MNPKLKNLLLVGFLLISSSIFAQNTKFTISGYVKDALSGETLIGVTIIDTKTGQGAVTNSYGFYTLTLPQDSVNLNYSYIGFENVTRNLYLDKDVLLNVNLGESTEVLEEVVVKADSNKEKIQSTQMSVANLSMKEAKKLPALFGEVDIIKTLQLKPGITSGGEGSSGIFVRGGSADQNLVLLDEAPIYNPSHLFGFFSTFNSDAVKAVDLYKGGFPAEYGGKLSSVIDVKLNEGNSQKFSATGGLGLIASRLTLEGPIIKDKSSFIISGRRTYVDLITKQVNKANEDNEEFTQIPDYFFYDLNAKAHYDFSDKDKVYLSGFFSRDKFNFADEDFNAEFDWGNNSGTARWNHVFTPKLFLNTTLTYASYDYEITNEFEEFSFKLSSGIEDYSFKTDFQYVPFSKHNIKFGTSAIYHQFDIGRLDTDSPDDIFEVELGETLDSYEYGLYVSDDYEATENLKINAGLRISGFDNGKFYAGLEPRFSSRYIINEDLSVKASYARMFQYIHLASNSGASLPTDIWYPSTQMVQPQRSDQVAGGVSYNLGDQFLITNEVYYKWSKNQVDFKDGAQIFANTELEQEFVFGDGWSYGNEFYIEKTKGKFRGWLGYTWSQSWREFEDINNGKKFHPTNDRRHDISLVAFYELTKRLTLTAAWVYNTGQAVSLPVGRYLLQDVEGTGPLVVPIYPERNSFRMPDYHRLDLGLVWKFSPTWGESDLTLSVYNAYDRRNAYFIFFEQQVEERVIGGETFEVTTGFKAQQVSLFPILPSITWNFKF